MILPACADNSGGESGQHADSTDSQDGAEETETDESSGGEDASTDGETDGETGGEQLEPIEIPRAWVERLEGSWSGPVDPTPIGAIQFFPLDFSWDVDGSLHAFTEFPGGDGSFDFRFRAEEGTWVFFEEGQLPGGMVQAYPLHPIDLEGDAVTWVFLEDPALLEVVTTVSDASFLMDVRVRESHHATFMLGR